MGYLTFGCNTGGLPMYIIEKIIEFVDVGIFIETGTAGGESITEASKHFKKCETIELIEGRANIDKKLKNVTWHTGNSIDILPKIVQHLVEEKRQLGLTEDEYKYTLFWLDAHYSDDVPNTSEYKECYILEELEIISRLQSDAIILIDDARLFMGHPPYPNNPKDWPSIQDIFVLAKEMYPHSLCNLVDDYILIIPERIRDVIDEEWRSRFTIRYPNAADKLKEQVKGVFEAVKEYLK